MLWILQHYCTCIFSHLNIYTHTAALMAKKKSCNFTKVEIETLCEEVESKRDILFACFSGTITKSLKDSAWAEIADKVSAVNSGEIRPPKSVKKKWQDMMSSAKRKEACRRREMAATGGGPSQVFENSH